MPLETGIWTINVNGHVGQLTISSVDPSGSVIGSISIPEVEGLQLQGFWNEVSQKITFIVSVPPTITQVYTAFLFQDQLRITGVTGSVVFTLAGYFQQFGRTGDFSGTARRNLFGWYAQIGVE